MITWSDSVSVRVVRIERGGVGGGGEDEPVALRRGRATSPRAAAGQGRERQRAKRSQVVRVDQRTRRREDEGT